MCDKLSPEGDSPDRWSRLTDKLKEAEQCNAQLRDVLEFTQLQVAQLTTERDGCRDLIATLRTRIAEVEQERDAAIRKVQTVSQQGEGIAEGLTACGELLVRRCEAAEQENARLREALDNKGDQ